ncbi:MAG: radical SAM protein [Candidatus Sericytochromatia bacterium]
MKVALLNLRPKYETYDVTISVPNGCDYLASYLNHHFPQSNAFVEYDYKRVLAQKPDIIGISSFTRTYSDAIEISRIIKKEMPHVLTIVGGHHISALPEDLDKNMDIGVIGEGEVTLLEIVKAYYENTLSENTLANIAGIIFRNSDGKFEKTKSRELIKNIDDLPVPYRTIVPNITGYWQDAIFTSRGCPFRCKYCAISEFWESMRYHSVDRVIQELNLILAKPENVSSIVIYDDLFGINKKRLKTLVDAVRSEGIHKRVQFNCNGRASVFDEEIAQMFVDMNIKNVVFGMESANDRILAYMKGATTAKQNQRALDLCKKYNITAVPNFIVGFPTETRAEAADTYWFIRRNIDDLTDFRVFPACPLPGTHLWDYAIEKGIVKKDYASWQNLDFFFDTELSVYLNPDEYDKFEYDKIMKDFIGLREQTRPFVISSGEKVEKLKYFINISKFLKSNEFLANKGLTLEITSENFSINDFAGKISDVSTKVIDGKVTLIPDTKFDTIILIHALEQSFNPKQELENIKKALNPNGKLVVFTYNSLNPLLTFKMLTTSSIYNSWNEKDRENIGTALSNVLAKSATEDVVNGMKETVHSNIFSFWGVNNPLNNHLFTKKTITDLVTETGFELLQNKNVSINIDKKIKHVYDTAKNFLNTYIGEDKIIQDESFVNINIFKNLV